MALTASQRDARAIVASQDAIAAQGEIAAFRVSRKLLAEAIRLWTESIDPAARIGQLSIEYSDSFFDAMTAGNVDGRLMALERAAPFVVKSQARSLGMAFRSTSSEALQFVQDRAALTSEQSAAIGEIYGTEANVIARNVGVELEKRVGTAFATATEQGMHVREGAQLIGKAFHDAGVVPQNKYLLETLFRTQTSLAYAAGRWQANEDPAIDEILWGYEYSTAGDDRVRLEHEALDGVQLPKKDPRWAQITPPNGFNCRCTLLEIYDTDDQEVITPPTDKLVIEEQTIIPGPDPAWQFHPLNSVGQVPKLVTTPAVGVQNKVKSS